jgi:hypothetical protein
MSLLKVLIFSSINQLAPNHGPIILIYLKLPLLKFICVTTLALGLRPRQGLAKVQAKYEARESHFMLPGVQENARE